MVVARDSSDEELATLRSLLGASDNAQVAELRRRLERHEQEHWERLSEDLPAAIKARASRDSALGQALVTPVERALKFSVARDPAPVVDAISPILGPAIRKAVSAALVGLLQSFNSALEFSLSPRALAWRVEAWRTGHSFAEVVLLHSLVFRVEQIFLIHRETGLVLQHVVAPSIVANDADMVSGMLTAIQDFVRDSFGGQEGSDLDAMQVGALTVWVERSPGIALAAVIRGVAPVALRGRLQDALGEVERRFGHHLAQFRGDPEPFEPTRDILETCLAEQKRESTRSSRLMWWLGPVVFFLGIWALWSWLTVEPPVVVEPPNPWLGYLARLREAPGVVVVSAERVGEELVLEGLRDPLSQDPVAIIGELGLDAGLVSARWTGFVSLAPELVLMRARQVLRPPEGVELAFEAGVLRVSGTPPPEWVVEARRVAPALAGVEEVDFSGLAGGGDPLPGVVQAVEMAAIRFATGKAEIEADQLGNVEQVHRVLVDLDRVAVALGREVEVEIVGHNDGTGSEGVNTALRLARASTVLNLLRSADLRRVRLRPVFKGENEPGVVGERAATFHVVTRTQ